MLTICTLDAQTRECDGRCVGCGWSLKEQKRRKDLLAKKGMTKGKNGIKRLIIKRKVSEE